MKELNQTAADQSAFLSGRLVTVETFVIHVYIHICVCVCVLELLSVVFWAND